MVRYAQFVIGPAGSGKSTYCSQLFEYCLSIKRILNIVNLDPAAESFNYPVSIDVRDLISLEDVMEEVKLGPNGALMYCMEYLEDSIEEWLAVELEAFGDDEYLVFDCPGEIELYSHVPVFRTIINYLQRNDWRVISVYTIDSHFMTDVTKFISGAMQALCSMVLLEVPNINLLTKLDLCPSKKNIDRFLYPEGKLLANELTSRMGSRYRNLNASIGTLLDDYSMVGFTPLDLSDEHSISSVLLVIDMAIQYGEEKEISQANNS